MKKLLALALASIGFVGSTAEAKASSNSPTTTMAAQAVAPQFGRQEWERQDRGRQDRWGRRDNHRLPPVMTQTRYVRYGWRVYRETYQIRCFPNGRVETRLISRERVR